MLDGGAVPWHVKKQPLMGAGLCLLFPLHLACSTPADSESRVAAGGKGATGASAGTGAILGGAGGAGGKPEATAGSGIDSGGSAGSGNPANGSAGETTGAAGGTGGGGVGGAGQSGGGIGGFATAGLGGGGAGGTSAMADQVMRSAGTFTFRHFPIMTNTDGVWNGPTAPSNQPTSTTYDTIVLENGYLRVTLLPSYGGRVLSIHHKPTNRELLYQNPLGTPYLMQQEIFYYDYLVIMGGIFPSFPEPEHGKYWNQPYAFEVVNETAEAVTVRMSRQDDRDLSIGVPARYDVGRTDVLVEVEVTLRAGSAALELDTKLTNTRTTAVTDFEYWTVTTLAPGSTPEETAIPLNTRILSRMDQVHLLESSWSWFGSAEERVSGEVFEWNNLAHFENWVDQGTAFAFPEYLANWSGLLNDDNDTAILRVSDENTQIRGLKLWTFGKPSLNIDINDPEEWLRPTIEMWHGITPEFWERATLAAGEVRTWSDRYFATVGLPDITAASAHGAVYLSSSESGTDTVLSAAAMLTTPNQAVRAILRMDGTVVAEMDIVSSAVEATRIDATVPSAEIVPGAVLEAEFFRDNESLLSAQVTLE